MAAPANSTTFSGDVWAELRLADARDVPHIHRLIHQMAEFELLTDLFAATEELLTSTLFPSPAPPPFTSFTALILDLSPSPLVPDSASTIASRCLDLSASPLVDPEAAAFASPRGGGRITAGFVICFPNYSTFLAKPGLYAEDIFVRAPWRRRGLGRMMLSAVAGRAAELGMGRVEWCVLDWNKNAINFYEGMGADVLPQWRICRLTGAALSYLSFGATSNLLFVVPMALGYLAMLLCRRRAGLITFLGAFGFLIACHVYYMSGDAWKDGGIDATGALMVLTLKVISCAINYSDGILKEESLRDAQKQYRLTKLPSLIEYFGYCLCCGSHFAGPVYEMKDYLEWTERKGIWASPTPSQLLPTLRALVQAGICMGLYLYLSPKFPLSRFSEPLYYEWGFWHRLFYQYMSGFTARWKYYFIWSISEAAINISGLGFTGWSDSSPPKARWDRAKNVDVLGVELAGSAVQLPLVWNIQVSTWLRYYVYERLIQKGKKPGFLQLLGTQTVSAIWHGLYPGYIIFFVQSALMINGSRVIYRWQQAVSNSVLRSILAFLNFAYTLLVLNYSCIGFQVLSFKETLASYQSVYYVGTVVPIVCLLLGYVIKPARPVKPKARKAE